MERIIYRCLRYLAIAGNVAFVLWILRNGINEGFKATPVEIVSYVGLVILLLLNTFLLLERQRKA
jgi:hypothetical protein